MKPRLMKSVKTFHNLYFNLHYKLYFVPHTMSLALLACTPTCMLIKLG